MDKPPFEIKDLTEICYRRRSLEMYPMLRQDLDILVSGYSSVYLSFFGIAFGTFVTVIMTLKTVALPEADHRLFSDVAVITLSFSALFGVLAARDWWKSRGVISQLRKETVEVHVTEASLKP